MHHWDTGKNKADNILINGRGRIDKDEFNANKEINSDTQMPLAKFTVKKGFRFRFRMISAAFTLCPIVVSIQNHSMTIIATDSSTVKPVKVESLVIHPGER